MGLASGNVSNTSLASLSTPSSLKKEKKPPHITPRSAARVKPISYASPASKGNTSHLNTSTTSNGQREDELISRSKNLRHLTAIEGPEEINLANYSGGDLLADVNDSFLSNPSTPARASSQPQPNSSTSPFLPNSPHLAHYPSEPALIRGRSAPEKRTTPKRLTPRPIAKEEVADAKTPEKGKIGGALTHLLGSLRGGKKDTSSSAPTLSVKAQRAGVSLVPSLSKLTDMSDKQLSSVVNFTVRHKTWGEVKFIDATDVRGLDIDALIRFGKGSIEVYPTDTYDKTKIPRKGKGLNKSAIITMYDVFSNSPAKGKGKLVEKYKKRTEKFGAEFISYDVATGTWCFQVDKFD